MINVHTSKRQTVTERKWGGGGDGGLGKEKKTKQVLWPNSEFKVVFEDH